MAARVLQAMALYLGIDEHYFDDKTDEGNSILRTIHYPPIEDASTSSIRAGQHEDINLITLLIGSHQSGLEILSRKGDWVPVTTVPGAIMCNIGDMMQRLTNHVFPSTTHRVVNPPGEDLSKPRYSIPYFLHPNADYVIDTLSTCISDDNPNRYPEPTGVTRVPAAASQGNRTVAGQAIAPYVAFQRPDIRISQGAWSEQQPRLVQ